MTIYYFNTSPYSAPDRNCRSSHWGSEMPKQLKKLESWPFPAVLVSAALAIGAIDSSTAGGTAVWILDIILIALSLYARKALLPYFLAAICSLTVLLSHFFMHPEIGNAPINWLSRGFGIVTFWTVAFIVGRFITAKKTFENNEIAAQALSEKLAAEAWLRKSLTAIN